jgi:hypothetical protein
MRINANTLLDPNADRSLFEVKAGDEFSPADLTVAEHKELMLAINTLSDRIHYLVRDFNQLEERVVKAEERLEVALSEE